MRMKKGHPLRGARVASATSLAVGGGRRTLAGCVVHPYRPSVAPLGGASRQVVTTREIHRSEGQPDLSGVQKECLRRLGPAVENELGVSVRLRELDVHIPIFFVCPRNLRGLLAVAVRPDSLVHESQFGLAEVKRDPCDHHRPGEIREISINDRHCPRFLPITKEHEWSYANLLPVGKFEIYEDAFAFGTGIIEIEHDFGSVAVGVLGGYEPPSIFRDGLGLHLALAGATQTLQGLFEHRRLLGGHGLELFRGDPDGLDGLDVGAVRADDDEKREKNPRCLSHGTLSGALPHGSVEPLFSSSDTSR